MIDTIRLVLESTPFPSLIPVGWERKRAKFEDESCDSWREQTCFQHKDTDLRIGGSDGFASWLEVSLPKVIHGYNGKLLRPDEINTAYWGAIDIASQVLKIVRPDKITRYDLVHHFEGLACDFVASLWGMKHKAVRSKPIAFFDTGIEWPGKQTRIRLYDKRMEQDNRLGIIQRLEFQLRKKALRDIWSANKGFDSEACYRQYKDLCSGFDYRKQPKLNTMAEILCWLKEHNVFIDGVDPVERFLSGRSRTTRWRWERVISTVQLEYFEANFSAFLPDLYSDLTYLDCLRSEKAKAA